MPPAPSRTAPPESPRPFQRRDWLITFLLALATIQTARADFFVNNTFLDWRQYALGHAPLPYQGRALLMPLLRWAGNSPAFRHITARYAVTVQIGTLFYEPITPEKFMSLLVGLVSLAAIMLAAFWWSRRRALSPWWLPNVLVLVIMGVTVALRSTTNYWYAYDLPHAALFGIGSILALEGLWPAMLLCFALDVPLRETALFSILMLAPVFFAQQSDPRTRWQRTAALVAGMGLYWAVIRLLIARHFRGNENQTYPRLAQNLHEILFPHHWPQLFSAGGYLILLVWLDRRRLAPIDRMLLYGAAACVPITLWFGVWTETRVWMEWTLPLAALASLEAIHWLNTRHSTSSVLPERSPG